MPVYASLLRAVNVGGRSIRMDVLGAIHESLGLTEVRTLLQSGNVVFATKDNDRARLAKAIEDAIETECGFRSAVMLRDAAALRKIVKENPFPAEAETDPGHLVVMFLAAKPDKSAAERIAAAYSGPEAMRIGGDNAYLTYPNGIGRSKLTNALLEKHLGVAGTARNWNTVTKLLALAQSLER